MSQFCAIGRHRELHRKKGKGGPYARCVPTTKATNVTMIFESQSSYAVAVKGIQRG